MIKLWPEFIHVLFASACLLKQSMHCQCSVTHHHELASTTSSWELQARKAAASSRCRTAPVRLLRTDLLSMVRRVTATQPVLGKMLCCWDMGKKKGGVLLSPSRSLGQDANPAMGLNPIQVCPVFPHTLYYQSTVFPLLPNFVVFKSQKKSSIEGKLCNPHKVSLRMRRYKQSPSRYDWIRNYSSMCPKGQILLVKYMNAVKSPIPGRA